MLPIGVISKGMMHILRPGRLTSMGAAGAFKPCHSGCRRSCSECVCTALLAITSNAWYVCCLISTCSTLYRLLAAYTPVSTQRSYA
jgi:hypothetical protein